MVPAAKNGPSKTSWGTLVPEQGGGRRTGRAKANELKIIGDLFTLEVVQLQVQAVNSVHLRGTSRSTTLWLLEMIYRDINGLSQKQRPQCH